MKLTNEIRTVIKRKALANVPTVDYLSLLSPVVQRVLCDHMPADVRRAYEDPAQRVYLRAVNGAVQRGNTRLYLTERTESGRQYTDFYGVPSAGYRDFLIRLDDEVVERLEEGTLAYDLAMDVIESGYYDKHVEQSDLLADVDKRLDATLRSVSTVNRLYDVLEPELHHLIPRETDKSALLPAAAAPVVADLRKLGAQLPDVPKKG